MSRLSRWLFPRSWKIGRDEALGIARAACDAGGVPWLEPTRVYRHYGDWAVWTYADHRGGNVRVIVDGRNGEVKLLTGPTPR